MKILVTGGNGFIGSHVVDNLVKKGHKVTIFDRFKNNSITSPKILQFLGDVKDRESVIEAVSHHDGVIHLAGILGTSEAIATPTQAIEVNTLGSINIYDAIKLHQKPAVTITVGNYLWNNTYSITKHAAEKFALMYNKEFGTKIAVVRGLNVYGERQKYLPVKKVVPTFAIAALKNKPIPIYGGGDQLLDLVYVKDCAEILVRALLFSHTMYNEVIEAGLGKTVSVTQLAMLIKKIAHSRSKITHVAMRAGEPEGSITVGNPNTLKELKFKTSMFTPLDKGLSKTISWYKKNLKQY